MATIWNIRGTNGSGKTTVARAFLPPNLNGDAAGGPVDLSWYASPTVKDPARCLRYPGYVRVIDRVMVLGHYDDGCGGMDRHPAGKGFVVPQTAIKYALQHMGFDNIICEGVLASGVYGSWHEFARVLAYENHEFCFVYLHTPVEECLERIQRRRELAGQPRKTGADWDRMVENVTGKWHGTMATRRKAIADGHLVFDLPHGREIEVTKWLVLMGPGNTSDTEQYRAHA